MVTKDRIAERVADELGLTKSKAGQAVGIVMDAIAEALGEGEEVRLTGFGTFRVSETRERMGRNPRTGEPLTIRASRRISFSPGSQLQRTVRGEE
ncbi:MAG: HU family DNA-binding protein [Chloroflexi bacterium]|nr:HU family DNA-binding protein [Chloroflexota bacterium]